jgi:hypothetical protein
MLFRHIKRAVTCHNNPQCHSLTPLYSQPTVVPGHETIPQNDLHHTSPKDQNLALIPHHVRAQRR